MKRLEIFALVSLVSALGAKSLDGVYHADVVRIYLRNELGPVSVSKEPNGPRTGFASLDGLLTEVSAVSMERWLPTATDRDRNGDFFLNRVFEVQLPETRADLLTVVHAFASDAHIALAERAPVHRLDYTPNDPKYSQQWYHPTVNSDSAWDLWDVAGGNEPGDPSIIVGVVDTGCEWTHPDLLNSLWQNLGEDADGDGATIEQVGSAWQLDSGDINGNDGDGNGYADDLIGWDVADADNNPTGPPGQGNNGVHMHGTHVAGISAAETNNAVGMASTGWSVRHLVVKCSEDTDPDSYVIGGYQGILYAAKAGANVINCSWGGGGYSASEQATVNTVFNSYGAIIVAAAGNGDANGSVYGAHYPSSYSNVVSVTALGQNDVWNDWANYHETVDVSAPGEGILSTVYTTASGGYQSWDGTSMASPVVASCVALLWSYYPAATATQIVDRIISTADSSIYDINSNPEWQGRLGAGRVDVFAAIASSLIPQLSVQSSSLQMAVDDGDGILNPGEEVYMRLVLENGPGWAAATDVSAVATTTSSDLEVLDSTATFPDIPSGSTGVNVTDRFRFRIVSTAAPGDFPVTVTVTSNDGLYTMEATLTITGSLTQSGFPFTTGNSVKTSPLIFDLDGDGDREIVAGSDDFKVYVLNADGTQAWSFATGNQVRSSPAVGDLEGDGDIEIVFGSKDYKLYVLNADGTSYATFTSSNSIYGTPALADLDGNGDLEIVWCDFGKNVYAVHHDGSSIPGYPKYLNESMMYAPAIGDLNGDGAPEIVVGTLSNKLHALDLAGNELAGFPYTAGSKFNADPTIADLEGDGLPEILAGSDDNKLHVVDGSGTAVFIFTTGADVRSGITADDVDGDGDLEIFFGSYDKKIYGLDHAGAALPGWPYTSAAAVESTPVVFDLNEDGSPEIITADVNGMVHGFGVDGSVAANFPIDLDASQEGSFCVGDLDGDGDPEIACGSGSEIVVLDIKTVAGTGMYWSLDRGNAQRTGNRSDLALEAREGRGQIPQRLTLHQNFPNPFNPSTAIRYDLPESGMVTLKVYDLVGREVRTLVSEVEDAGYRQVVWDGRDGAGQVVPAGIYIYRLQVGSFIQSRKMVLVK